MRIWLPCALYQFFPLFCVLLGFYIIATLHTLLAIVVTATLYTYSFTILWMRWHNEPEEEDES